MNMKAIISIVVLATAFVCASAHELRGGPNVMSDVAPTDANRESHDKMTKFVGRFEVCDTFAMKLSNCLLSNGESFNEAIQCVDCIYDAYNTYLQGDFKCAELKEAGFCDATDLCKFRMCDNLCSTEIDNWLSCHIVWKGCDDEDKDYWKECMVDGI